MKLAVWTYEGPPHVGAMRVATAMKDLHFVLHAPQGDTYADLLFTMIDRRSARQGRRVHRHQFRSPKAGPPERVQVEQGLLALHRYRCSLHPMADRRV